MFGQFDFIDDSSDLQQIKPNIFNWDNPSKEIKDALSSICGNPFSYVDQLKMKGVRQYNLYVQFLSSPISELWENLPDSQLCTIELRTKGLVIAVETEEANFAIAVPYKRLVIYKSSNLLTLHSATLKISMEPSTKESIPISFVNKLISLRGS